jgi:hypothetical protein
VHAGDGRHLQECRARDCAVLDDATSARDAKTGLLALAGDYRTAYPSAMRVIDEHVGRLVAHLRFPLEHRKRTRSTHLLGRYRGGAWVRRTVRRWCVIGSCDARWRLPPAHCLSPRCPLRAQRPPARRTSGFKPSRADG